MLTITILHTRKLNHREVKQFAQGCTASDVMRFLTQAI